MKFKGHMFWTFLYLLIIAYFLEPIPIVLLLIIAFIGTMPDIDSNIFRKYKKDKDKESLIEVNNPHRWIPLHSLLLPILAYVYYPNILTILILLAFGHHFFLDCLFQLLKLKKETGYYTICLIPSYEFNFILYKVKTKAIRLGGRMSTIFLLGNFLLSLVFLGFYIFK